MNPRLPQGVVDAALAEDPHRGAAEFNNRWREDLSDCFPLDAIEACTEYGTYERAPQQGVHYVAFCDVALGSGSDSFTLCIAHRLLFGEDVVTIDAIRERKPRFVPSEVIKDYSTLLKSYGISEVQGDRVGGGMVSDEWLRHDIRFKPSDHTTSENYLRALPILLAKRASLLDNATLRNQLASLERHVTGTRETVSHPNVASAHDDVATSVCGALVVCGNRLAFDESWSWVDGTPIQQTNSGDDYETKQRQLSEANARWRQLQFNAFVANGGYGRRW
jgi:hypothetical protein